MQVLSFLMDLDTTTIALTVLAVSLTTFLLLVHLLLPPSPAVLDLTSPSQNHHVVITGGSSGIGLAIAKRLANSKGVSHITLISRSSFKLAAAKKEIESALTTPPANPSLEIITLSADLAVTSESSFAALSTTITSRLAPLPPPSILFNCAGVALAKTLADADMDFFSHLHNVNVMGTVAATRIFMKVMQSNCGGRIVITSSCAGQIGLFGYTAYSSSKFALRGFAESLVMEAAPSNIFVTLAYPPNTQTPGFDKENEAKPALTRQMEDEAGLYDADTIAKGMISGAVRGKYSCYWGLEGWMLNTVTGGMGRCDTVWDFACQIFLSSLLRFVGMFYLMDFRNIVKKGSKDSKQ